MVTVAASEAIAGVVVVQPEVHRDDRGLLVETYRRRWFPQAREMVQANRADRRRGSVVGLHYHLRQADYWYVPSGRARVVLHDLRVGSPTDGATVALDLGAGPDEEAPDLEAPDLEALDLEALDLGAGPDEEQRHRGVLIPPGVAHGFAALTDVTITYLVDGYHDPADELGLAWDDPEVGADWGVAEPVLSERDRRNPRRADIDPRWRPHGGRL
ncbi:MAG: dTDP-4-dehydrorhamnose 3,5-epimerase family protein [Acidimicrobiales bacterium]